MQRGDDVNAITVAVTEIGRLLSTVPQSVGESRAGQERVLIVPPLAVLYEVHEEEAIVLILGLRYRIPKRGEA